MSLLDGIRKAISFKYERGEGPLISDREKKLLLAGSVAALVILAIVVLAAESFNSSALQSCTGILFRQQKYDCIYNLANSTGNYSMCSLLPQGILSNACIGNIAENSQNVTICDSISGRGVVYANCIVNISNSTNDISYCNKLQGGNVSACAFGVARKNAFANLSDCDAIPNSSQRAVCSYIYYYDIAQASGTQRYCTALPNETNGTLLTVLASKDYLDANVLATYDYLSFSALNVTLQQYCNYGVAVSSRNKTLCSYSGILSQPCYSYINISNSTITLNASSLCASVPSYAADICTYAVFTDEALAQKNISSCMIINNTAYMNACIVQLASTYNDSSYCNYISNDSSAQQACYSSASIVVK